MDTCRRHRGQRVFLAHFRRKTRPMTNPVEANNIKVLGSGIALMTATPARQKPSEPAVEYAGHGALTMFPSESLVA